VIVGVDAIPPCLDLDQLRFAIQPNAFQAHVQAYDSLLCHPVRTDPAGFLATDLAALDPWLAEGCDTSADRQTFTVRLKRGVTSRAGHELTSHDVKWAFERAFALNSWASRMCRRFGLDSPDAVRPLQNHTVQVRLAEPAQGLPLLLAQPIPPIYDLEEIREHCPIGDPWGLAYLKTRAAGYGPYDVQLTPGEEVVFKANERYWQGSPKVKRLIMRPIPDGRERANALLAGSVDLVMDLPKSELTRLSRSADVRLERQRDGRQIVLRIDPTFPPLDQPAVRKALLIGLPYREAAELLSPGSTAPAGQPVQDRKGARS
jgi:peptide/nickel transport system substrate-binding protein